MITIEVIEQPDQTYNLQVFHRI